MTKLLERHRSLVFLVGTILAGLILIGGLMIYDSDGVSTVVIVDPPPPQNDKTLQNKIYNLSTQPFNPGIYNTIATEIEMSHRQNLITGATKGLLQSQLKSTYGLLVYKQCDLLLNGNSAASSNSILGWLAQLENISSRNTQIDFYRDQIKWYEYYLNVFPAKVNGFINGGTTSFVETTYLDYKSKLQSMPGLDSKFSHSPKFESIKNNLISRLDNLYNDFVDGASL